MSTPAPATRVADLNAKIRATRNSTGCVTVGCPACGAEDAHSVEVEIMRGRNASAMGPAEGDAFDFAVPEECIACGHAYTSAERVELDREIHAEAAHQYGREYRTTFTGAI